MQFLSEFWGDSLQIYSNLWGEHRILAYDPINKICAIYINEDEPLEIQRWYIAVGIASDLSANAEELTYSFICPDIILEFCNMKTSQDIKKTVRFLLERPT